MRSTLTRQSVMVLNVTGYNLASERLCVSVMPVNVFPRTKTCCKLHLCVSVLFCTRPSREIVRTRITGESFHRFIYFSTGSRCTGEPQTYLAPSTSSLKKFLHIRKKNTKNEGLREYFSLEGLKRRSRNNKRNMLYRINSRKQMVNQHLLEQS